MNIPNILTVFRLIAAPAVGIVYVFFPSPYADWIALSLFILAALTDYLDGYLARKWGQVTAFGRMLDPIADKAMVMIALLVVGMRSQYIPGYSNLAVLLPIVLIMFREVFVAGLREFLGDRASTLQVTKLAKWKTAAQMVAIIVILSSFLFGHYYWALSSGMSDEILLGILDGEIEDRFGLRWIIPMFDWSVRIGIWLLWAAAVLTFVTGFDYFRKSLPILKEI